MNFKPWLKATLVCLISLVLLSIGGRVLAQSLFGSAKSGADRIALITVEGMITADSHSGGGPFGGELGASSVAICEDLYDALEDESVKGVLLRINSPGGSAAGSDEIFQAIREVRKHKKVVASMGDVAASGGYYIASACDYIFANGATLTGSIGVIFELVNWGELADKWGVRSEALHAGEYKDLGSPWRPMTEAERQKMQTMLSEVHSQFIRAVDEGRDNLDEAAVRKLATGMIYTGEQAAANGLIDEVGGLEAAKAKARSLAGLPADASVERLYTPTLWEELMGMNIRQQGLTPAAELASLASGLASDSLTLLARSLYLDSTLRDLRLR